MVAKGSGAVRRAAALAPGLLALAAALVLLAAGEAHADLLDEVEGVFDNVYSLATTVYYGIVGIITVVCFVVFGKELLPAIVDGQKRQSREFKEHCYNAIIAAVVLVVFFLLPVIVPAFVSFFGTTTGMDTSFLG